jgi:hypothetical protein
VYHRPSLSAFFEAATKAIAITTPEIRMIISKLRTIGRHDSHQIANLLQVQHTNNSWTTLHRFELDKNGTRALLASALTGTLSFWVLH